MALKRWCMKADMLYGNSQLCGIITWDKNEKQNNIGTPYIAITKEVITNSYKGHVVTYMVQSLAVACS